MTTAPNYLVEEAMIRRGLAADQARNIANEIFQDDFNTCVDKSNEEIDADFKTLESSSVAQGQIRLRPSAKTNIRAFVQWTRDELRLQRDPRLTVFPVSDARNLIRRYKTHQHFIKN